MRSDDDMRRLTDTDAEMERLLDRAFVAQDGAAEAATDVALALRKVHGFSGLMLRLTSPTIRDGDALLLAKGFHRLGEELTIGLDAFARWRDALDMKAEFERKAFGE